MSTNYSRKDSLEDSQEDSQEDSPKDSRRDSSKDLRETQKDSRKDPQRVSIILSAKLSKSLYILEEECKELYKGADQPVSWPDTVEINSRTISN